MSEQSTIGSSQALDTHPRIQRAPAPHQLSNQQVLIWGVGRHGGGLAAARWCQAHGAQVAVLEQRVPQQLPAAFAEAASRGWPWHVGNLSHPILADVDLIVASPAIPPAVLNKLPDDGPAICCPEGLFFAAHKGTRIVVTGTKGKSTTSAIIGRLLEMPVAGNSSEPLLSALTRLGSDQPMVCELSSFQLWYLQVQAPHVDALVITNIGSDHLDWHPGLDHYRIAKLRAADWADRVFCDESVAKMLPDDVARMPPLAFDDQAFLAADGSAVLGIDHCRLSGAHNRRNAGLALAVALAQGADPLHLGQQLASVEPLPHRLEQIHQQDTLHFVDDSIATTPEAAMAALASVSGPVAVVLGGSDKGVDFARLAKSVVQRAAFPVLIGDTARCLHEQLEEQGCNAPICASLDDAMERAVDWLHTEHERNGTVLLSPACASFGMFSDFEERGDRFAAIARSRWPVADETSER